MQSNMNMIKNACEFTALFFTPRLVNLMVSFLSPFDVKFPAEKLKMLFLSDWFDAPRNWIPSLVLQMLSLPATLVDFFLWVLQWLRYLNQLRWPSGNSVRFWSCRLRIDSRSRVKPITLKLVFSIYSFLAWCSALKGQCGEQAGKFTCCDCGKST